MDTNRQPNIEKLLEKYRSSSLNPEDLKTLKQAVNAYTDDELATYVSKEWQKHNNMKPIDVTVQQQMFANIKQRTQPHRLSLWKQKGWAVAASVIFVIMASISLHLYHGNREMLELSNRNVVVKVGKGERVSITLPDGTSVRLNSESELSYQQDFGLKDRKVSLSGEGFFDVVQNKKQTFTVNTQFMDIKVLGTAFNVYTYQNSDLVEMTLVRGHVEVTNTNPPYQTIDVHPNEKVVYNKKTGKMHLDNMLNRLETAWISHELVFRSTSLKDVLKQVGRKYGFSIEVTNEQLLNEQYTGVFDETEINDVMNILKAHFGFDYWIKENMIQIEKK